MQLKEEFEFQSQNSENTEKSVTDSKTGQNPKGVEILYEMYYYYD